MHSMKSIFKKKKSEKSILKTHFFQYTVPQIQNLMNFQWKNTFVTLALIVEGATEEVSQS